jgi:hypothetical protein
LFPNKNTTINFTHRRKSRLAFPEHIKREV